MGTTKGGRVPFIHMLLQFDEAQKSVMDLTRTPVPYHYFHMVNIMLMVCVSLWSIAMAMTESLLGPCAFISAAFIMIGMLELATMLSDPFGDDEVDFPIQIWCDKFLENQLAFLEYEDEGANYGNYGLESKLEHASKLKYHPGEVSCFIGTRD